MNKKDKFVELYIDQAEHIVRTGSIEAALALPELYELSGIKYPGPLVRANHIHEEGKPAYLTKNTTLARCYYDDITDLLDRARSRCPEGAKTGKIHEIMAKIEKITDNIATHTISCQIPELTEDRKNLTHATLQLKTHTQRFMQYRQEYPECREFLKIQKEAGQSIATMLAFLIPLELVIAVQRQKSKDNKYNNTYFFLLKTS